MSENLHSDEGVRQRLGLGAWIAGLFGKGFGGDVLVARDPDEFEPIGPIATDLTEDEVARLAHRVMSRDSQDRSTSEFAKPKLTLVKGEIE